MDKEENSEGRDAISVHTMGHHNAHRGTCSLLTSIWLWFAVLLVSSSLCYPAAHARAQVIPSTLLLTPAVGSPPSSSSALDKRSATAAQMASADYADYQSGVRYDEYPVVVPKRTAMLLDRIMSEIQNAMGEGPGHSSPAADIPDTMDLQRRGQQKGRIYWRCYFNAVTCFKRK
ncbi:uncharacterized protein AstCC [Anabrus simplex]|uniref:uncharacterized protein AstCC n=1 Tax=Anabrus simplex TaxID=316456 RepID=UPI0035A2722F